ncbi:MAG: sulfatase-like hydrolase/transferase [Actinomycetota bacterium]
MTDSVEPPVSTRASGAPARGLWRDFAVHLTLCTVALTQPLLQLYGGNVTVFVAAELEGWSILWFAVLFALVPAVVMSAVEAIARGFSERAGRIVHLAWVFLGAWVAWSVVLRSVSLGAWPVDAAFTAVWGAATTVAYTRAGLIRTWLAYFSPFSVAVVALFAVSANAVIWPPDVELVAVTTTVPTSSVPGAEPGIDPADVSVVWIVLDEAPLFPLLTTSGTINANRFPGFAALAGSSTWYRNATAMSQSTHHAVPAMMSGKWARSNIGPVLANWPKNIFTLMNGRLSMDGHEVATALCPKKLCAQVSVTGGEHIANPGEVPPPGAAAAPTTTSTTTTTLPPQPSAATRWSGFLRDTRVVLGHRILPEGLRERLPPIDEGWGNFGNVDAQVDAPDEEPAPDASAGATTTTLGRTEEQLEKANSTTGREWEEGGPMSQVPVIEGVISRAARADRPTLHFAHVLLPHRPWMLAPDMRRSRALPTDKRSNLIVDRVRDEYQAHLLQYAATDTIVADLVATLKKSANWDRTLLIVTADHGITFETGESKRKTINPAAKGTLEDIYRVPMFVKYPGQSAPKVDDCPVAGVDLLPTVIGVTGIDPGWELQGSDLSRTCPRRSSRPIVWPDGKATLRTGFPAVVERARRYDEWVDAEGDVDDIVRAGLHGSLVGETVPGAVTEDAAGQWRLDKPEDFRKVGSKRFELVPTLVEGSFTASRDIAADEEGLLVVDGRFVGAVSELAGLKAGETTNFRSTLLSRVIPPGSHRVELWLAKGRRGSVTFTRLP